MTVLRSVSPTVFLDRDGILNELVPDPVSGLFESPYSPGDVSVPDAALEAVALLREAGARLIVVSNQPAAAKGTCTLSDLAAVDEAVQAAFAAHGLAFDAVEYCHHHPGGIVPGLTRTCQCRKPHPGLLVAGAAAARIDSFEPAWIIGDSDVDVIAGREFGATTILVEEPRSSHRRTGSVQPDYRVGSVVSAAEIVVARTCLARSGDT